MVINLDLPVNPQYYVPLSRENVMRKLCEVYLKDHGYGEIKTLPTSDFENTVVEEIYKVLKTDSRGLTLLQQLTNALSGDLKLKSFSHRRSVVSIIFE